MVNFVVAREMSSNYRNHMSVCSSSLVNKSPFGCPIHAFCLVMRLSEGDAMFWQVYLIQDMSALE